MMFYNFHQNNSGGFFIENDHVSQYVIVEANDPNHANEIAEGIGIYFNGVRDGRDCECCGSRWSRIWEEETGTERPEIWGDSPESCGHCIVYHLNGKKDSHGQS